MTSMETDVGASRWRPLKGLLALLAMAGLLLAAGCGGDDDENGTANGEEIATGPGFDGETIRVGAITPETGPVEVIGSPLTNGNRVWFDYVNEELGGIGGEYPVELVVADSRYEPQTAVQQYNRLNDDVVLFAQVLGTAITSAVVPQLERDNIVAAPASLDSLWVREQQLAPAGAPYQLQAINGITHWIDTEGSTDAAICSIIQNDVYGEAGLEGLEHAAQELGFEIAQEVRFAQGDEDFSGQIGQLAGADCDAVFIAALPTEAGGILGTAAQAEFAPRWIGLSPMWAAGLLESPLVPYMQQTLWVVAEGPEWGDEEVPGMVDMIERQEQYAPQQSPDFYFTFGYNQARIISEILEQAVENGDLSREGIVEAMNQLGTISMDGIGGDYEYGPPADRVPPTENTVMSVDPDAPFGLTSEATISSPTAEGFEFEEEEIPAG